ncbi:DHS-like NAD/FAD-binding domain-containing protein [Syncephalis plumigaleata]|nr:DHS-like NAD/FAD-binding domain-containing protein [Syncephalis plumigaleata]
MTPPPTSAGERENGTNGVTAIPPPQPASTTSATPAFAFTTPVDHNTPLSSQEGQYVNDILSLESKDIPFETKPVRGYDFNQGIDWTKLIDSFGTTGFQATALSRAIEEVNKMLRWRLSDDPINVNDPNEIHDPERRRNTRCTIFLGYTSNMASCGVREVIRYLAQHRMIDCIVTTTGGAALRGRALNRIGNLILPNNHYVKLYDWLNPILDQMVIEEDAGAHWTPSKFIDRIGKEINHPDSIYYWCHKNKIPVFCPALTDGALGENLHLHSLNGRTISVDIVPDSCAIDRISVRARKSGIIIIGGGIAKHHICNANLKRGGADYAVYMNTGQEFDGSDAGARPDEAVSWGKIKSVATPIKVYAEASIVFPILVARTFARVHQEYLLANGEKKIEETATVNNVKSMNGKS